MFLVLALCQSKWQLGRQICRLTNRQAGRQADSKVDKQTDGSVHGCLSKTCPIYIFFFSLLFWNTYLCESCFSKFSLSLVLSSSCSWKDMKQGVNTLCKLKKPEVWPAYRPLSPGLQSIFCPLKFFFKWLWLANVKTKIELSYWTGLQQLKTLAKTLKTVRNFDNCFSSLEIKLKKVSHSFVRMVIN